MTNSIENIYSIIDAPTASFKNQDTWVDPLTITDVIWESIPYTKKSSLLSLVGYSHESQTDHIHMSKGELTFILVKNELAYKVNLKAGDGKVLIIYPNVWHSAVNYNDSEAIFINMAKRHAKPGKNDFVQITKSIS